MTSELLLIAGVFVLSLALRTLSRPVFFRLGTLGLLATSFLSGWLLGGSVVLGCMLAATWILLPWMEIMTRVRRLKLPVERRLQPARPPSRETFPTFTAMTDEIEGAGFEHQCDIGWSFDESKYFYRVFQDPKQRWQATICLSEQPGIAFFYTTVTSRLRDGRSFSTWNYPFSYGLKIQPSMRVNRFSGKGSFDAVMKAHARYLEKEGVAREEFLDEAPEAVIEAMQDEMREQIAHNIDVGVLRREGTDFIRYTTRGLFYLWGQFLRDLVRL